MDQGKPAIQLLYWADCPSWPRALDEVQRLISEFELDPAETLQVTEIITEEDAIRESFYGSPTIRIDGVDVDPQPPEVAQFGLTCRVYQRPDGRFSPLPDFEQVSNALKAAIARSDN